jgi:hypothetical protein
MVDALNSCSSLHLNRKEIAMRRILDYTPLRSVDTFDHDSMHINDWRARHLCQTQAQCSPGKPAPSDEAIHRKAWGGLVVDRPSPEARAMHVHTIGPDRRKIDGAAGKRESY